VGILLIHRVNNYLGHIAGAEFAKRGFVVLAMNSRFDNNETEVIWEAIALDVKTGVEYMKKQLGVRRVVLFGHSGGGPSLSYYQAVAEHGAEYCNAATKLFKCGADYPVLPRADGMIFVDAGLGNPIGLLRGMNPAVGADDDPQITRPELDPLNPANGFNPNGPSTYSEDFKRKYYAAQADRMNRLIAAARAKMAPEGTRRFPDDDVVLIARASGGRLSSFDPTLDTGLVEPRKVLKINGRVVTERVRNQQPFVPSSGRSGGTFAAASLLTVRSFLSTNAIRATDSMTGVDWCSSNNSTPCAVQQISVPLLFTAMQGGSPIGDSEFVYTLAASKDKDFVVVEGASHNIDPCLECEHRKGEYNNTVKNFFDYAAKWINTRW
jgi:pimeloyl-ACP methyl ester carboxylesterase